MTRFYQRTTAIVAAVEGISLELLSVIAGMIALVCAHPDELPSRA